MTPPPETIESGYPPKTFRFTGEWEQMNSHGQRGSKTAFRNRRMVWYPKYESDDGEVILSAEFIRLSDPEQDDIALAP